MMGQINPMPEKVITVKGSIGPDDLGIVLPHEHLLWDLRCWAQPEPEELGERKRVKQPVSMENRGHVVYHPFQYHDNLCLSDIDIAIDEVKKFRAVGGNALCDVTTESLGRDPEAQYRISQATDVHIIMGTAFYVESSWTDKEKDMSVNEMKQKIMNEFENGVGQMMIKPGILGEIGISDIQNPHEIQSLKASGMVQHELGCPVMVHTPIWEKEGNKILDIIEESGGDSRRVVLSHLDPTMHDLDYADSLAKRGAFIEYDLFDTHIMSYEGEFLPSDNERIEVIVEQIGRGNLEHILISHDTCMKIKLTRWGGHGYAHIVENIVPRLLRKGLSREQIDILLIANPKRFLAW
jgi:phosphotriesterase-related protein